MTIAQGAEGTDRVVALIEVLPTALWVSLVVFVVLYLGRDLIRSLGRRVSRIEVAGVSAQFSAAMESAAEVSVTQITSSQRHGAEARALRNLDITKGFRALWVDDTPLSNHREAELLRALGILVDQVPTSGEGIDRLRREAYDVVISDIARPSPDGLEFLAEIRRLALPVPLIYYITNVDTTKPVPVGAFGIANRVDTLVHLVLDVVERRRLA